MKKITKLAALLLVAALSLTVLVGCVGTKPEDIDKYYSNVGEKLNATIVYGDYLLESAKGKIHVTSGKTEYYVEYTDAASYTYEKDSNGNWTKTADSKVQKQYNPLDSVAVSWKGSDYTYSKDIKGFKCETTVLLITTVQTLVFDGNNCTATLKVGSASTSYAVSKVGSTKVSLPKVNA